MGIKNFRIAPIIYFIYFLIFQDVDPLFSHARPLVFARAHRSTIVKILSTCAKNQNFCAVSCFEHDFVAWTWPKFKKNAVTPYKGQKCYAKSSFKT